VLDLNETISRMLQMLQPLLGEGIRLQWNPRDSIWPINVDPSQIDQMVANLCVNARDAIGEIGHIAIETNNVTIDEACCAGLPQIVPGEYVQFSVSDDGCGMEKAMLGLIFEPFFTTKNPDEGTGLGLATVYGAVQQNGGFVNVDSEPGRGTTFTIYLPRYKGKADETQMASESVHPKNGGEVILLVEDEPPILEITTTMLEEEGYTVLSASTPSEAIHLAQEHRGEIHLLLTDVIMPEMNGVHLARNLSLDFPGLKSLFMSGYTNDIIAPYGLVEKEIDFLPKPFSMEELTGKVRDVLSPGRERRKNHGS
ncbi:MAG: ATP-binding protein, partial [Syntrophales bacterium LBB04]|nr:ATP-binding protein [Syntrophales bacterium LBB04]